MKFNLNYLTLFIITILGSCNYDSDKPNLENSDTTTFVKSESCIPYFDFDEVEYYHIDISEEQFNYLNKKEISQKTKKEDFILYTLKEDASSDLKQNNFVYSLSNYGLNKKDVLMTELDQFNQIFCDRNHESYSETACLPIYRDILLFKRSNEIIGIAKLCFDCEKFSFSGTQQNTHGFGESGDFEKLNQLLSKYREK